MRVRTWIGIGAWVVMASGCTMGLGETTSFATRNLSISGELADGAFAIEDGTVTVISNEREPELGVSIFLDANDETRTIASSLVVLGNLGALCPGASVELVADGDRLIPVAVEGAPPMVVAPLMGLEMTMNTDARVPSGDEQFVAQRLVMSSTEGEGGFTRMNFEGSAVVDGERRVVTGSFEIARIVEDTEVPGWEGDTWEDQPITNWD